MAYHATRRLLPRLRPPWPGTIRQTDLHHIGACGRACQLSHCRFMPDHSRVSGRPPQPDLPERTRQLRAARRTAPPRPGRYRHAAGDNGAIKKLDSNRNHIGVRTFILYGAPFAYKTANPGDRGASASRHRLVQYFVPADNADLVTGQQRRQLWAPPAATRR
jgi:hypothetical protein